MDHSRSSEIMEPHAQRWEEVSSAAHGCQPAVRSPGPVSDDGVNETSDAEAVEKITNEPGAANHCPRGDGRASIGKSELENPDRQERHAGGFISRRCTLQEEPVITNEPVAVSKHEGKTDGVKQNAAKTSIHHALHQHVHGFTGAAEAGFQHGETDLHAEHEECGDQRPGSVDRIDDISGLYFR